MVGTNKKGHRTVEVADPDLGGAGVEIESAFFVHLALGIRRGKDFDTDFGCACEDKGSLPELGSTPGEPSEVNGLYAIGSRERTLCQSAAVRKEISEEVCNVPLAIGVGKTWWGSHEDMPVSIGLDPVGELGQFRIGHDLGPASEVEAGLRLEIRELDRDGHAGKIRQEMEKHIDSRNAVKRMRWFALGCLGGVAGMWAVCAIGLRVNGTDSEPIGIYWAISKTPARGDFVFALPPANPLFKLAKERGYLAAGPSPAGTCGLIKQVAALSGDRVTIGVQGVQVNGVLLKNSAPRPADEAGRPLSAYELSDYALRSEEVLLMSDYNPASFDGRYFGPLSKTTIQSVIVPVITLK